MREGRCFGVGGLGGLMFSEEDLDDRVQRFSKPEVPGELVRARHGRKKSPDGKTGARLN